MLSDSAVYTFYDSAGSSAPTVTGTLSVSPGNQYSVKFEIYLTDLNSDHEYATITIGGQNFGTCNPVFSDAQGGCYWYDCSPDATVIADSTHLTKGSFLASSGQTAAVATATYSSTVDCFSCLDDCAWEGVDTLGIIRITLTQGSLLSYYLYDCAVFRKKTLKKLQKVFRCY